MKRQPLPDAYDEVRRRVLERDGWRCQRCGCRHSLEVHHQVFRSHSGTDEMSNLITLCAACHRSEHGIRGSNLAKFGGNFGNTSTASNVTHITWFPLSSALRC